jgi:hypothetical protein
MAAPLRTPFHGTVETAVSPRARSGSFDATLTAMHEGVKVGSATLHHSATERTTTIHTLENNRPAVSGVGRVLVNHSEALATRASSTRLETTGTAREAMGFYRAMGFAPDPVELARVSAIPEISHDQREQYVATWQKAVVAPELSFKDRMTQKFRGLF